MSNIEKGKFSEPEWEGLHGLRAAETGRITEVYEHLETNLWLEHAGLPPMLEGETYAQWEERIKSTPEEDTASAEQTDDNQSEGEVDGTN